MVSVGCGTGTLHGSHYDAGQDTLASGDSMENADAPTTVVNLSFPIRPAPMLDLLFVVDNGPSMAAKQPKLAAELAKIISGLSNICNGDKVDLRLAAITTDMGTDGVSASGACGPKTNGSLKGDAGKFQFVNAAACGVTDTRQPWLVENRNVSPLQRNFSGDIGAVFACIVSNLGTSGCGFSQPLQALEAAFYDPTNAALQRYGFLRSDADLGIVIVSDQDDCSVGNNSSMFASTSSVAGESMRLRCTTRALACGGRNLSAAPPGYPTTAAFATDFASCVPRTDYCRPGIDASQATDCTPLVDYRVIANELKQLKADPQYQITVTGFLGSPIDNAQTASAQLVIDQTPNPDTTDPAHSQLFDVWPLCYDPSRPSVNPATNFDSEAAATGAVGGVRLASFIDEFNWAGEKFSICQSDFSTALEDVVARCIDSKRWCIDEKLLDTDLARPGVQVSCKVWDSVPALGSPSGPYTDSPLFPQCDDTQAEVPCWQVVENWAQCPVSGQFVRILREPDTTFNVGTKVNIQCLTCVQGPDNPPFLPGCDY